MAKRSRYPTHLLTSRDRVACGAKNARSASEDPSLVTCGRCQRTIHMADAEARQALDRKRKERR